MFSRIRVLFICIVLLFTTIIYCSAAGISKKDSFVTVKNGHLYRYDKRLRLWGVNFCVNVKRDGNDLELAFDRMQDAGFNGVRINLFYGTFLSGDDRTNTYDIPDTVLGSGSDMDKLDHSILLAKQRDMVFWFSFDHPNFSPKDYDVIPDDGTRTEWSEAVQKVGGMDLIYIDNRAEAAHKAYARSILEHVNPYTGTRYADEPTIGLYEINNENAFIENLVYGGMWKNLPQYCKDNVTKRWNEWLQKKYGSDANLAKAWNKLQDGESLSKSNVAFAPIQEDVEIQELQGYVKTYVSKDNKTGSYSHQRAEDVVRFACDLYDGYNQRFIKYVRSLAKPGIGINVVPITPTGRYSGNLPMYYGASRCDFVSNGLYGFACRENEVDPKNAYYPWKSYMNYQPIQFGQPVDLTRVKGKPYLLYEVNDYRPSPFRIEYPMHVAANAIWQDADGAFWFNWDDNGYQANLHTDEDYVNLGLPQPDPGYPNAGLLLANDEVMLTSIKTAGTMFLNGKIAPASHPKTVKIGKDLIFDISGKFLGGLTDLLRSNAWTSGIRLEYDPDHNSNIPANVQINGTSLDAGKNIHFDWSNGRGYMKINAPNVRNYTGFSSGSVSIGDTYITGLNRDFLSANFISEDGQPLGKSKSVLMTLVSGSQNTGYVFDITRKKQAFAPGLAEAVVNGGRPPVNVDRVSALVTAPWIEGMTYEKYDFARKCYERGIVNGSISVNSSEPLFYCRLRARAKQRIVRKILIMGNSLTCHGPSTEVLGWKGNWGMAATSEDRDYAHTLTRLIGENQNIKPELKIVTFYEGAIKTFQPPVDYKPDLVVVQVGDNVPVDKVNVEDTGIPYGKVLEKLKENNEPLIVCVSSWGRRDDLDSIMRQFALRNGASFVYISQLINYENMAISEGNFTHPGVNWHPGNRGMKRIAETIWQAVKPLLYTSSK